MSDDALTSTMGGSSLHPDAANLVPIAVVDHVTDAVSEMTETLKL